MTIINFIFPQHENLPEINHYIAYFSMQGIVCFKNLKVMPRTIEKTEMYVEWHIMGTHFTIDRDLLIRLTVKVI